MAQAVLEEVLKAVTPEVAEMLCNAMEDPDHGHAYVVNVDEEDHKFWVYDGGDFLKWIACQETTIRAGHDGVLHSHTSNKCMKVHVDCLGIAGSVEQSIVKGKVYSYDGEGFKMIHKRR